MGEQDRVKCTVALLEALFGKAFQINLSPPEKYQKKAALNINNAAFSFCIPTNWNLDSTSQSCV